MSKQKITTCLWFDGQAEEAAAFYTAVFENAKTGKMARYGDFVPSKKGSVMTKTFVLEGREFMALNGGPQFKFTEAISLVVHCETQKEVDYYWEALAEGGSHSRCGWLKDRFGLSWQVVPDALMRLASGPDAAKSGRVMQAMMQMTKIDIAALEQAAAG